jgi:DNA-binding LacI/PurR family transcriptional regulator
MRFSNEPYKAFTTPSLSKYDQIAIKMGVQTATLLIDRLNINQNGKPNAKKTLGVTLIIRFF